MNDKRYVVRFIYHDTTCSYDYYGGKSYRYCGEKYAVICGLEEARRYKTKEQAEKAVLERVFDSDSIGSLGSRSCFNAPDDFEIIEIEE